MIESWLNADPELKVGILKLHKLLARHLFNELVIDSSMVSFIASA